MGVTKFKGPVNSIDGFQFNGIACTPAGTRIVTTAGKGSKIMLASYVGLSAVYWGWADRTNIATAGTKLICSVETSKNGVVSSAASFQVTYRMSTDSTLSNPSALMGACTIDCILGGAA